MPDCVAEQGGFEPPVPRGPVPPDQVLSGVRDEGRGASGQKIDRIRLID
jgi:hypothetical protein